MTKEQAVRFLELAESFDIEASIYEGYSGRGMYGKETTGIRVDTRTEGAQIEGAMMAENGEKPGFRYDSLGKQAVVY